MSKIPSVTEISTEQSNNCITYWPQFDFLRIPDIKKKLEFALSKCNSDEQTIIETGISRLVKGDLVGACKCLVDINYGIKFYTPQNDPTCSKGIILGFRSCCR